MRIRNFWVTLLAVCLPAVTVAAETVIVAASRDATLIEDPDGAKANGSGPSLFVGRTSSDQNGARRALLHFDVAASIPQNASIEDATLVLYMSPSNDASRELWLYRALADWDEGPSASSGGGGAPSEPGDATWLHTFYDTEFWAHPGGQFRGRPSAVTQVVGSGFYAWGGTVHVVQDVRLWNSAPCRNFGWILIGDETTRQTSKKFASREHPDSALWPLLEVTYRLPGARPGR